MSEAVIKGTRIVAGLVLASAGVLGAMNQWEGDVHTVYADKLAHGLPTVCSGHTDWKLRVGTPYTKEECARINGGNAEKFGQAIIACTRHGQPGGPTLNQNQFDALTLFAINVGIKGACGSRAVRLIENQRYDDGCRALATSPDGSPAWSYASGVYVQGLQNRRRFERDWCLKPMPPEPEEPQGAA